ncbi:MAG: hypothetical protein HC874_30395 [Richelia sp. SL_2_1]|nr:hypothetical protein [Richelia sp. SL_2_1]
MKTYNDIVDEILSTDSAQRERINNLIEFMELCITQAIKDDMYLVDIEIVKKHMPKYCQAYIINELKQSNWRFIIQKEDANIIIIRFYLDRGNNTYDSKS